MTIVATSEPQVRIERLDPSPPANRPAWLAALCILVLCAIGAVLAVLSDGGYMDDDVTHYLISRTAWERPALLLDEWGRPGFTIPYAAVAWIGPVEFGFTASRWLSVILLSASAWMTYRVAQGLNVRHASAAAVLLLAMPLGFFASHTTTTETIAAFYAIAGTCLLLRGHRWWAAAVLALLPVTRHELIVFLVPIGLYFLWRRDLVAAALLAWAEVTWNLLTWSMSLYPPSGKLPIERFFSTSDAGMLGYGSPWHYLLRWIDMSGMVIVALVIVGAGLFLRRVLSQPVDVSPRQRIRDYLLDRKDRVALLVVGGAIGLVLLQTWLYMVNTHLSGGYARFLIPAGPWMAICAAMGLSPVVRMWQTRRLDRGARWLLILLAITVTISLMPGTVPLVSEATLVALLLGACLTLLRPTGWLIRATCGLAIVVMACEWAGLARPHQLTDDQRLLHEALADLRTQYPDHHITGSSPWIQYFLDHPVNLPRWHDPLPWDLQRHPVKTLYVYDQTHGKQYVLEAMAELPHRQVAEYTHPDADEPYLRIYQRLE